MAKCIAFCYIILGRITLFLKFTTPQLELVINLSDCNTRYKRTIAFGGIVDPEYAPINLTFYHSSTDQK